MADTQLHMQPVVRERLTRHRTDWSAVWGGAFTFAGIWMVFESLALAIFGTAHLGSGIAAWTIILTIIAMYVAGLETARLAGVSTRRDGIAHGMMMFGLAITSAMVAVFLSNLTVNGLGGSMQSALLTGVSSGMAWTAFLSLFLGWLAAMGGASMWKEQKSMTLKHAVPVRPAA